ncbi:S-adenosylmethionine:tRNA ribosyltransferase-isomerase [Sporosarcina sp. Te-1]|uniref:S-adenosylmethionine:tRNA ribosyltransferase-isomerase n=1 Tax=Sporosarcina sp. Te-1 TaxID=2818390 RepID=UPI001A9E0196|nr:S-adenosylmethionine:tRNA ribosyltransferase-isomerase [Sporosarcina sp. Te-1]QTD39524.1 S-adenosylmethionine:tRNA ribosyltransferase-isomerase [Sporosarcina sp. Te-1]
MAVTSLDFHLPDELNASHPPEKRGLRRDHVRLMVLNRTTGEICHDRFDHLLHYLQPGDLIIVNNSRTIPAVLRGKWSRQQQQLAAQVEVRLARRRNENTWEALILADSVQLGDTLHFPADLAASVISKQDHSPLMTIQFSKTGSDLFQDIYSIGEPIRYEYIQEPWGLDSYQTVFGSHPGSVEMPSAGRAFSWELLFSLMQKGVQIEYIQLHTGLSYLLDDEYEQSPEDNEEEYNISERTMQKILQTKASGNRVIAVGTTVVRALESAALTNALSGVTNLYINRHYPLQLVNGMITGLHEPKASHLEMLSAFVSEGHLQAAYTEAIQSRYLWHEFGDMNLIM